MVHAALLKQDHGQVHLLEKAFQYPQIINGRGIRWKPEGAYAFTPPWAVA